ncbi:hypothetical protein RMCBS344292_18171 [Rhizopus microsporus]|nr:hypothetical protein RMCBS344292_18171 [Rhizopus microsporus]
MGDFIQMILDTMDIPTLDNNDSNEATETQEQTGPSVYKYPGDGSLLMPEIPDDDAQTTETGKKRPASVMEEEKDTTDNNSNNNKRVKEEP